MEVKHEETKKTKERTGNAFHCTMVVGMMPEAGTIKVSAAELLQERIII